MTLYRPNARALIAQRPGPPEVLQMTEGAVPVPGKGEVRVAVAYCGLNPLDVLARSGRMNYLVGAWPIVLGIEHSGVVDAVGPDVDPSWLGRRVVSRTTFGGNADYSIDPISDLAQLPDRIDLLTGAVFRGAGQTAWRVLHERAKIRAGQWLLIHSAAGAVGVLLVQLAKRAGMSVVGLVGNSAKRRFAESFGADRIIVADDGVDWLAAVRQEIPRGGVDLIVDGKGGPLAANNFEVLAPSGTLVILGATSGLPHPPGSPSFLIRKNATMSGFNLPIAESVGRDPKELDEDLAGWMAAGQLRVPITEVVPLDAAPILHRRFESRDILGRAVLEVGGRAVEAAAATHEWIAPRS